MKRNLRVWRIPLSLLLCVVGASLVQPQQEPQTDAKPGGEMITRAMRDELARSMEKLRLPWSAPTRRAWRELSFLRLALHPSVALVAAGLDLLPRRIKAN